MSRTFNTHKAIWAAMLAAFLLGLTAGAFADDEVAKARALAFQGPQHRPEAIALLQARLATHPTDTDALTLYGTILSWEGRYAEAHTALQKVLDEDPTHSDALPAGSGRTRQTRAREQSR
jgi:cytochrome c-type biogenesis protein CcmH/NrfG